jgi:hypothetical protein
MNPTTPLLASEQQRASLHAGDSDTPLRRCGIPVDQHHEQDKPLLFLETLHVAGEKEFDEMTSLFVRRSVYFAFFGKPTRTRASGTRTHQQPRSSETDQETLDRGDPERLAWPQQQRLEQHPGAHEVENSLPQAPHSIYPLGGTETLAQDELNLIRICLQERNKRKRIEDLIKRCLKKRNKGARNKTSNKDE